MGRWGETQIKYHLWNVFQGKKKKMNRIQNKKYKGVGGGGGEKLK